MTVVCATHLKDVFTSGEPVIIQCFPGAALPQAVHLVPAADSGKVGVCPGQPCLLVCVEIKQYGTDFPFKQLHLFTPSPELFVATEPLNLCD
jgi:hypothetical protein